MHVSHTIEYILKDYLNDQKVETCLYNIHFDSNFTYLLEHWAVLYYHKASETTRQKRNLIMSNWQYLIKSFNCPIVHSGPPRDLYIILIAINQTKDFNRQSILEMFGWGWRSEIIFQGWPDVTRGDMHVLISSAALCWTCLFTALQLSTLKAYSLMNPFRKCWSTP